MIPGNASRAFRTFSVTGLRFENTAVGLAVQLCRCEGIEDVVVDPDHDHVSVRYDPRRLEAVEVDWLVCRCGYLPGDANAPHRGGALPI